MADFRFIHSADIHLDSPLVGLESLDDAPIDVLRGATRQALRNLVDLCIEEKVAFLLIAGDVYDGDWKSAETGRFFARQMQRLANADPPIPVYLIKGNHDAASLITREMNVSCVHTFPHNKAATELLENYHVAIHGRSYARFDVSEDLSLGYPDPIPGWFNIGLLHTCATGRDGHQRYAPCDPNALAQKGYDYWALGHIHNREILNDNPYIVFSGNIQGRHVREIAVEGKGCSVVSVQSGVVTELRHVPLDVVRWDLVEVDLSSATSKAEAIEIVAASLGERATSLEGRLLAARLRIVGLTPVSLEIHQDRTTFIENLRERVAGLPEEIWLEDVLVETRAPTFDDDGDDGAGVSGMVNALRFYAESNKDALYHDRVLPLVLRLKSVSPDLPASLGINGSDVVLELLPEIEQAVMGIASRKQVP